MTGLLNLVSLRLWQIDFTKPLVYFDLFLASFLIIAFLVYIRRFPVFRVFLGLLFLLVAASLFFLTGFIFTALVFGVVSNLILIAMPLIFAPEIRHYLEKLGRFPFLHIPAVGEKRTKDQLIRNLVGAIFDLAAHSKGAIVVLQRQTGLGEIVETGAIIDARLGTKLLQNIFFPKSPLHDGAVVIKDGRILAAGCIIPLHPEVKLDPPFGLRHRAGLSITKDTDAISIMVSEQRGEVSLAENGKLNINLNRAELTSNLQKLWQ
ncbi:diadenylate cyclase [Candidatus Daviesbacteria bacterium]|nr:diadenylate cyclase [Candidatus Daviesbacteria bacterium]